MPPDYHQFQIKVSGRWLTFFLLGMGFEENCRLFRLLREDIQCSGFIFPCRMINVHPSDELRGGNVYDNQSQFPAIADIVRTFTFNNLL